MAGSHAPVRGGKLLGSYVYQIDDKGRVSLPAAFRRDAADQRFVLIQVNAPSLALYPEIEWAQVEERALDLVKHQPESRLFILSMLSNAVEVTPDSQGRILIPARLKEAAQLNGQALLVGAIDKVEIWNPDLFQEALRQDAGTWKQFAPKIFR